MLDCLIEETGRQLVDMISPFSFICSAFLLDASCLAFITSTRYAQKVSIQSSSSIFSSRGEEDGGIEDFDSKRMDLVRSLQRSFYSDDAPVDDSGIQTMEDDTDILISSAKTTSFDATTGKINNLPLWRVGWVETPGRRNCLNVHEMHYTHMFQKILSQSKPDEPMYFGHLYLPGGTRAAKSGEERYQLKTWREELDDENRFEDYSSSSTLSSPDIKTPMVDRSDVVGCLMEIVDHRRMEDGRLMILVQALERFVVDEIVDTLPFSIANVQVILDKEELPWEESIDENDCKYIRGKVVEESFSLHEYEFNKPELPISDGNYLTQESVPWTEISELLPFAYYSTDDSCLDIVVEKTQSNTIKDENVDKSGELPIEQELWNGGVLWEPPPVSNVITRRSQDTKEDTDALETLLWLALEDFCRATGFTLPEEIRCLLPPEMDYLDIQTDHYLSSKYPKIRRQKRLSYLAPALIENVEIPMKGLRQVWLNTPSIAARLNSALERYDYINNKLLGQYE